MNANNIYSILNQLRVSATNGGRFLRIEGTRNGQTSDQWLFAWSAGAPSSPRYFVFACRLNMTNKDQHLYVSSGSVGGYGSVPILLSS